MTPAPEPASIDHGIPDRRSPVFGPIVGVLLWAPAFGFTACSGCSQPAVEDVGAGVDRNGIAFERHEIVIGSAKHPTVLTGFLLGGAVADVAVVDIDEADPDGNRLLRIHAFEQGTWTPRLDAALGPDVVFVDVAEVGGTDRLVGYAPGRLSWFDPESRSLRELVAVTSSFEAPREGEVPHVDVTRDVNGDGRDDLVVPGVGGFLVFVQGESGAFADPVSVGPSAEMSRILGADGYRYDPWSRSRVHELDFDRDGRADLVFWDEDHFAVHTQDERGLFTPEARAFTTEVAFDSDDLSSLATGDMLGKRLHSLADLNGDGVADLVVYSLEGRRISKKRSSYQVHFGAPTSDGGTAFAPEVGAAFHSDDGVQIGMDLHDFDRDGRLDLMLTTIDLEFLEGSLWKRIKGAMGDDVWLGLEFYRSEDGLFPDEPSATRRIALDGVPSHREPGWVPLEVVLLGGKHESRRRRESYPRAFNTTLRIGDVTGDGRSDLIIADHPRIMTVFAGVPGPELFARRAQEVALAIPNDEEHIWLVDLDRDGRQDIVMHHPFTLRDGHGARTQRPGTEPHRVTMLMAR